MVTGCVNALCTYVNIYHFYLNNSCLCYKYNFVFKFLQVAFLIYVIIYKIMCLMFLVYIGYNIYFHENIIIIPILCTLKT